MMFGIVLTSTLFPFASGVVDTFITNNDVKEIASLYNVSKDVRYMVVQRLKLLPVDCEFWKYFFNLANDIKHLIDLDFINIFRDRIEFALDRYVINNDLQSIKNILCLYNLSIDVKSMVVQRLKRIPIDHEFWACFFYLANDIKHLIDSDFNNIFRDRIEYAIDRFVVDGDVLEVMLLFRFNREIVADRLNMLPDQHRFWHVFLCTFARTRNIIDRDFIDEFHKKIFLKLN